MSTLCYDSVQPLPRYLGSYVMKVTGAQHSFQSAWDSGRIPCRNHGIAGFSQHDVPRIIQIDFQAVLCSST